MKTISILIATLVLLSSCGYVPFPGGKLEGVQSATPSNWSAVAHINIIQLETQPEDPYSVKLWMVAMDSSIYLHAGANQTTWVEHIDANNNVRLLVENSLYELQAQRVEEQSEFDRFSDVYEKKYGNRPRNEIVSEAYLFRLIPRS